MLCTSNDETGSHCIGTEDTVIILSRFVPPYARTGSLGGVILASKACINSGICSATGIFSAVSASVL